MHTNMHMHTHAHVHTHAPINTRAHTTLLCSQLHQNRLKSSENLYVSLSLPPPPSPVTPNLTLALALPLSLSQFSHFDSLSCSFDQDISLERKLEKRLPKKVQKTKKLFMHLKGLSGVAFDAACIFPFFFSISLSTSRDYQAWRWEKIGGHEQLVVDPRPPTSRGWQGQCRD